MTSSATRPYWRSADAPVRQVPDAELSWAVAILAGLLSGALATLVFQEGTLALLHRWGPDFPVLAALFGAVPRPFSLDPASPFGLPHLVVEMAWGGLWGIVLAALICRGRRVPALATGVTYSVVVIGSLILVILPALRGMPLVFAEVPRLVRLTLLLCAAWGWGTALLLKLISRR
ncbi:MAG: hypothetical protein K2X74_11650 [Acetobacteraceae bacterium]|nr:hypothetical protein [Acetobacteraceae bacterium]